MNKRQYDDYQTRHELSNAGWGVSKTDSVKFNGGVESLAHANLKLICAWYLKQECDYRIDTEVEGETGEIDVLAWSEDDIIAIECETSPVQEVIDDKLSRYVKGQPIRECFVLNVNDAPNNLLECYEWVSKEIGL